MPMQVWENVHLNWTISFSFKCLLFHMYMENCNNILDFHFNLNKFSPIESLHQLACIFKLAVVLGQNFFVKTKVFMISSV